MYNEQDRNQYEYHYSYRPNYSEPIPTLEPVQPKGHSIWKRVTAGVLCGTLLLGGAFGAGWFLRNTGSGGPSRGTVSIPRSTRSRPARAL